MHRKQFQFDRIRVYYVENAQQAVVISRLVNLARKGPFLTIFVSVGGRGGAAQGRFDCVQSATPFVMALCLHLI